MTIKKGLSNNTVLLILSGVIVLLLITLTVLKINEHNELNDAISQQEASIQENQDRLINLQYLDSIKPALKYAFEALNKQVPKEPMEHQIIAQINSITLDNETDFLDIHFDERLQKNNLNEMPIKLKFSGSYTSFIKVIKYLEQGERLFRIDEIKINKSDNGLSTITAEIIASTFYGQ